MGVSQEPTIIATENRLPKWQKENLAFLAQSSLELPVSGRFSMQEIADSARKLPTVRIHNSSNWYRMTYYRTLRDSDRQ